MGSMDDAAALAAALREAREYTLSIYGHLDATQRAFPYLATVNPPAWELAHVAWFHEHWCLRWVDGMARRPSTFPNADPLLNSALIPHADRWDRPELAWPAVEGYLARVLDAQCARLTGSPPDDRYFFRLALHHEDMHAEAFLMSLQTLGLPEPAWRGAPLRAPAAVPVRARAVAFGGGAFELGTRPGAYFIQDNECGAHAVEVEPFALATLAVTQGEYAEFVDAQGYAEPRWWSAAGWAWRELAQATQPRYWVRQDGTWRVRRFDRVEPLDQDAAMVHVNAHEAEAYAKFRGARLPTEVEWEFGARAGLPPERDRLPWGDTARGAPAVCLDGAYARPVAVQALPEGDTPGGLRQMIGNVWEWTATTFAPYPGFTPGPYQEYSAPWFGDHRVLRGGSWATRNRLVHSRWRNFYTPDRNDAFAGIRLAWTIE
jgi:iron(II)-dependent oxidoreductase